MHYLFGDEPAANAVSSGKRLKLNIGNTSTADKGLLNIINMRIDDLVPYERNPRNNDAAVEYVANSIREFGFKVPIIIDRDNVIVAGHTRLKAAKQLGLTEVPVIIADDLTPEQIKAFRLVDNRTAEYATWDQDLLMNELMELKTESFEMQPFGFTNESIEIDRQEVREDDYEVELPEEPTVKHGEIYQLGNHRLMCGDSTNIEQVKLLVDGKNVELVVTDPPYNMAYQGAGNTPKHKREQNKILNDKMSDDDFEMFLSSTYKAMCEVMNEGASFYTFYKELGRGVFITALRNTELTFKQELIWVKNQIVLGGSNYQSMYEPCVYGCKGEKVGQWYGRRRERSVIEDIDMMAETEVKTLLKETLSLFDTDVIRENKQLKNDLHPTMKPIKLLSKFIINSSMKKNNVLDLFGGSGSTMIACEQLDRQCFMMEYDPKYADVIIDRWETFTGQKAVKLERA